MTLLDVVLKTCKERRSTCELQINLDSVHSPPPTIAKIIEVEKKTKRKRISRFSSVVSKVDSSPPRLDVVGQWIHLSGTRGGQHCKRLFKENLAQVLAIRKIMLYGGKVDCWWGRDKPRVGDFKYRQRVNFLNNIMRDNRQFYGYLSTTRSKVPSTKELLQDWQANKRIIIDGSRRDFVLFPQIPTEDVEDKNFLPNPGVKRPRVYLTLSTPNDCSLGTLCVELFTDMCPRTCALFTMLAMGDTVGFSYVDTSIFRKVPNLFWSGGDVSYDNGFGCYAPPGHRYPIGPENYHYSHSMPGLLSMRVTADDEVCGIFNITFKALPYLDLKNVVFGRVVRPSKTLELMKSFGKPLSSYPVVKILSTKLKVKGKWTQGVKNTNIINLYPQRRSVQN